MKLSIIIPVYNERATIVALIERLKRAGVEGYEWIFVDDGSSDGTTELLRQNVPQNQKLIVQPINLGKSAAVGAGLSAATGEWIIVQDADLEYDPAQIPKLLDVAELLTNRKDNLSQHEPEAPADLLAKSAIASGSSNNDEQIAIYGMRPAYWHRPSRSLFALGVLGIDLAFFVIYRRWVRDHATCYKLMRKSLLDSFELQATGFEGCIEITAKLMRSGIPIISVPIRYQPRSVAEGKKLTMSYGWIAIKNVWKFRRWHPACGGG